MWQMHSLHSHAYQDQCLSFSILSSIPMQEVLSWELGSPVGDAAWSPFSSTVLAAATDAGRVFVFDLDQNPAAPLCAQKVLAWVLAGAACMTWFACRMLQPCDHLACLLAFSPFRWLPKPG